MTRFWSVAVQTVLEILRARTLVVVLIVLMVVAWGSIFVGDVAMEPREAVAVDLGVVGSAFIAVVLAIILADEHIGAAARPVSQPALVAGAGRARLLLGRWFGTAFVSAALALIMPLLVMLMFLAVFGLAPAELRDLAACVVLLPLEVILLTSVTAFLSIAMPRAVSLSVAFGFWMICHMHVSTKTFDPNFLERLAIFLSVILPDLELYNPRLFIVNNPDLLLAAISQCGLYSTLMLLVTVHFYGRRDF